MSHVPGPRGVPVLGVAPELLRDPYQPFLRWAAEHGDVYRPRLPGVTLTMVDHPDHVREVLGAGADRMAKGRMNRRLEPVLGDGIPISEGEKWRRNRRLMNPMFGRKQLDRLTATVAEAVEERVDGWARWNGSGEVIDLDPPFGSVTMNVLLKAMFGTAVDPDDVDRTVADFRDIGRFMAGRLLTVWAPNWMPVPFQRKGRPAVERVNGMIDELITARRRDPAEHDDLLSALIDARFEDGEPLTAKELRDELMGLLFGGFETTQSALGWTVALLDQHPEARHALVDEVSALGGRLPTSWDEVQALTWTKACFDEAQRLQGAPLFNREAVIDQEIGGVPVPTGSLVAVSPYSLHRKPSLWAHPDRYDPTRFVGTDIDRFAFIPFGAGPRHCIGSNLAYLEATLTLAALYGRHEVRMRDGFTPEHDFHLSTGMKGGCPVVLDARQAA